MSALSVHNPRDMAFTTTDATGSSANRVLVAFRVSHNDLL